METISFVAALSLALLTALSLSGCDDGGKPRGRLASRLFRWANGTIQNRIARWLALAEKAKVKRWRCSTPRKSELDGAAAMVLTFSVPLNPDQDFSAQRASCRR